VLFTVAIVIFVGRHFARDWAAASGEVVLRRPLNFEWLATSGALYLTGLAVSLCFWVLLLRRLGQSPGWIAAIRAYYLGHTGKYLPGKAWALMLRSGLIRSSGVRTGIAVSSSFYEVLTTMAGGTLLAALLCAALLPIRNAPLSRESFRWLLHPDAADYNRPDGKILAVFALILTAIVGVPLLPPVFRVLARRLAAPFRSLDSADLPTPGWSSLGEGLLITGLGWLVMGTSLWAVMRSLLGEALPFAWDLWGRYSTYLALAYVAGFVVVLIPSGLGIREYFLKVLLTQELNFFTRLPEAEAAKIAVAAVLLLRLVWTISEVVIVSIVYWFPGPRLTALRSAPAQAARNASP
jgi:hypothetical protein